MTEGMFKTSLLIINILISVRLCYINKESYENKMGVVFVLFLLISLGGNLIYILATDGEFKLSTFLMSPLRGPISLYSFGIYLYTATSIYLLFNPQFRGKKRNSNRLEKNEFISRYIDPNDINLITDDDINWQMELSPRDIETLRNQDDIFRMGRFSKLIESGHNDVSAAKAVLKDYPFYYIYPSQRCIMPMSETGEIIYTDDELRLPFCLKNRVNNLFLSSSHDSSKKRLLNYYTSTSKSLNSMIRQMITDKNL